MSITNETKKWASERFGIDPENVLWYNSGTCYDRIGVTTKEAADKVTAEAKGTYANGGMLDGMPLGGQSKYKDEQGNPWYDVTC